VNYVNLIIDCRRIIRHFFFIFAILNEKGITPKENEEKENKIKIENMNKWFECKVKYDKQQQDGSVKMTTEIYLVDALSFTEAESRIILEMKPYISGEFEVDAVKHVKITDMFNAHDSNADKWYKSKVNLIAIDEEKGVEKRVGTTVYVKGSDIKSALETLVAGMDKGVSDYEIANIAETPILDVFEYAVIEKKPVTGENE